MNCIEGGLCEVNEEIQFLIDVQLNKYDMKNAGLKEVEIGKEINGYESGNGIEYRQCSKCGLITKTNNFDIGESRCRDCRSYYRMANFDKRKKYNQEWRKNNPVTKDQAGQRYRAKKAALPDSETSQQRTKVWVDMNSACSLTGLGCDVAADHVIPIAVGHGGTTYGNMIPLDATLNISKNDRHIFEWFDANHARLGLKRDKFDALIAYLADANEMTVAEYRAYVDWCFDNPRIIDEASGELVFADGPINERNQNGKQAIA